MLRNASVLLLVALLFVMTCEAQNAAMDLSLRHSDRNGRDSPVFRPSVTQFLLKISLPATEFDNLRINIELHSRTIKSVHSVAKNYSCKH